MQAILITGASRGLRLEFARQYLARGARMFAGCRRPERPESLHELQATDPQHLTVVPVEVTDAGIYIAHSSAGPVERLGELTFEDALTVLWINAVAPLLVAQQYGPAAMGDHRQAHRPVLGLRDGIGEYGWLPVLLQRQQGGAEHVHALPGRRPEAMGHHDGGARSRMGPHRHGRPLAQRPLPQLAGRGGAVVSIVAACGATGGRSQA